MSYSELLEHMTPEERDFVAEVVTNPTNLWTPLPGPQTLAYESDADIIGYGGAAGGGKTDLACGKALTRHKKTMILRREATQLTGIVDRLTEILGSRTGFNGQDKVWRLPGGRQIELGSVPHLGNETKYQGRPHDWLVFDEASNFLESQVRFLLGWLRSTDPNQRCQALFAFNPPTTSDGRWLIDFFAPWLQKNHPNPAQPGEIRWFYTVDDKDYEAPDNKPFILGEENERIYDFETDEVDADQIIKPMSRTFIPSRVVDNPYLHGTGYMRTLQALPEPLRSQMLLGDFHAGVGEDPWQVIPTAWVEQAMERWEDKHRKPEMDNVGVDVARGGKDETVIARRHGNWFDKLLAYPGTETPDGPHVAGLVIAACRDGANQHVEINGVGVSPVDFLREASQPVTGVDVGVTTKETDETNLLSFTNVRSRMWWRLREALDPNSNRGLALPPDDKLRADLTAPKWRLVGQRIQVESREEIIKRIGRSPDRGTAVCLALFDTPKRKQLQAMTKENRAQNDPYLVGAGVHDDDNRGYNPYEGLT